MNDYSLPLVVLRKLANDYESAMLKRNFNDAYKIGSELVEMALKLQDIVND